MKTQSYKRYQWSYFGPLVDEAINKKAIFYGSIIGKLIG